MPLPTDEQRLALRDRPARSALMYQSWNDLLFLHWCVEPDVIQKLLPAGLFVDCFNGNAFLGVVPFFMKNIRFRGTTSLPWISNFLELNVRTYVFDETGRPGVWFISLDCNQPLAVWAARTLFHLPYQHASMTASQKKGQTIDYHSQRSTQSEANESSHFTYSLQTNVAYAQPGTLDFFLIERYLLFAVNRRKQILRGQVHHTPYPLCNAEVRHAETDLFKLNGLSSIQHSFDHAIGSHGVNVEVFALIH